MTNMQSKILQLISERGYFSDCTDESGLDKVLCSEQPQPIYIGFDCTAPSLHVGSLIQIMILRHIQKCGHKPIVLMGGGTTKVGDPSGKDESRQMLTDAQIQANMDSIKQIFAQFMDFEDKFDADSNKAFMVNNDDWLSKLSYIDFLRDYGPYFSINRMLTMDSVKLRLERESHLSFLEFNYMILQAYDFVELNKQYNCRVQIGGSDQWGNIIGGIRLFRCVRFDKGNITKEDRENTNNGLDVLENFDKRTEVFGLTTPLITTASGGKMGKTAEGAVWLRAEQCSPYDYWQFWRNTEDADVGRFLRLFTELDIVKIAQLEKSEGAAINDAKIILANAATRLAHGADEAQKACDTARKVFEQGGVGDDLPSVEVDKAELDAGIPAFKLFQLAGLEQSGGAARRLIKGGGAKINGQSVDNAEQVITITDFKGADFIKLSAGKKRHSIVKTK